MNYFPYAYSVPPPWSVPYSPSPFFYPTDTFMPMCNQYDPSIFFAPLSSPLAPPVIVDDPAADPSVFAPPVVFEPVITPKKKTGLN